MSAWGNSWGTSWLDAWGVPNVPIDLTLPLFINLNSGETSVYLESGETQIYLDSGETSTGLEN